MEMYAVLYSKFSQASQRFLTLLETVPKFRAQATIVCVDNREVRQRVLTDQKLQVQEVPCVIRVFADSGYTELFEGEQAFTLLKSVMIDSNTPSQQQQHQPVTPLTPIAPPTSPVIMAAAPPEMTPLPGPKLPQQMTLQQHMALVEHGNQMPQMPQMPQTPENFIQVAQQNPVFEEIPSKPAPSNAVTSTYLQEIEKENMQRLAPERTVKSNNNTGGNLITRAQQMQKEREAEMSSSGPGMRAVP